MSANDNMVFNRRDVNSDNDDVWDDAALIKMYDRTKAMTYDKLQKTSAQEQKDILAARTWKVGDHCMAPFAEDGKYYPAKITKVLDKRKTCEVVYTEYDTTAIGIKLMDLLSEDDVEYAEDAKTDVQNGQDVSEESSSGSQKQQIFPVPELCPPPPPNLFQQIAQAGNDKEALTNMLMSWYMSGYHTGYFQGMQQGKKKQSGGSR